jgi:hypothetical protein
MRTIKPVTLCEQCPEFQEIEEEIVDATRKYQGAMFTGSDDSLNLAIGLREAAMRRAHAHKWICPLCSNIEAAGSSRTFSSQRPNSFWSTWNSLLVSANSRHRITARCSEPLLSRPEPNQQQSQENHNDNH